MYFSHSYTYPVSIVNSYGSEVSQPYNQIYTQCLRSEEVAIDKPPAQRAIKGFINSKLLMTKDEGRINTVIAMVHMIYSRIQRYIVLTVTL